jgi:hypothetical protein
VLLRLTYLGLTNTFAMLRLLPMTDRDKDIEILVLRHQIAVPQRQLGAPRCDLVQLTPVRLRRNANEAAGVRIRRQ